MAPTTEQKTHSVRTQGHTLGDLLLRVVGGEHHGRTVRLQAAKCTLGSAPGCTLRLRAPGIEPLHALIMRGPNGTLVRRVGMECDLNGRSFEDAPLRTGDRLRVGPITFVVAAGEAESQPRPSQRIVTATQQREFDRLSLKTARQLGHQRLRQAVQALRKNRQEVRDLSLAADRRKHELDRLVMQLSQVQRDLTSERERHLQDLDQQRSLGLQVSQLSHSLERVRQETLSAQTKHQAETDHWRLERSRLTEDLGKREHQLHQLQTEMQRRQWDLDQLQSQNDRLQRQLELEHEQAAAARVRFQQEQATSQLERTRAQEELLAKDRQLSQATVELQLRQREAEQLRETVERLQKQLAAEQQQLQAELARQQTGTDSQERDRLAADVVARDRQISELQGELLGQQATVTQLREELARRRDELSDFKAEAGRTTQAWDIERLQMIGKVSEAAAHDAALLSERQQAMLELETRFHDLEEQLRNREREIEAQRTELSILRNERDLRLTETREWQSRALSTEQEISEVRKTNAELSLQLANQASLELTTVVPMLAGNSPRISQEQQEELERQREELRVRERELNEQQATLEERLRRLESAEIELSQEQQGVLNRKADLQSEQDRLSAAARRLVEQERELIIGQEALADKEEQFRQLQIQLEAKVGALEGFSPAPEAAGAQASPTDMAVATPAESGVVSAETAAEKKFVHESASPPEIPLGVEAVDFSAAQAELESLRSQLSTENHSLASPNLEVTPGDAESDGIMLPTAEAPSENVAPRFRRPAEEKLESAAAPSPVPEHAAPTDAVMAEGFKDAPPVQPDMLPNWSYEHETPERMDTIMGLRLRNMLSNISEDVSESSSITPPAGVESETPPNLEATSESSVEDILSRLRQAGVLKTEGGAAASQASPAFAPPAEEAPAAPYPSQYEQPAEEVEPEAPSFPQAVAAPSAGGEGEGDDIEAYMQQLMRRVRGDAAPSVSTSGPNPMYKAAAAPLAGQDPGLSTAKPTPAPTPKLTTPVTAEEFVPRSQAPEQSAGMAAMRELANNQARSAIHVHQKKLGKQQGGAKTVVALCAIAFGGFAAYIGIQNGSWTAFAAAGLSIGIGSYWLLQALWMAARSLVNLPQRMVLERPKPQERDPRG